MKQHLMALFLRYSQRTASDVVVAIVVPVVVHVRKTTVIAIATDEAVRILE